MTQCKSWWRGAVMYQIYPRSFRDTNEDGVGDLKGITEKLSYVADLGVEGIWLSTFFKSPMKDYGYDVSDYCDVDPLFGSLDDFRALLDRAHKLGLKIIVDFVMNHTSEEHPWFIESKQDKTNSKADWYVWADPKPDGSPPNNWLSIFGGSAWQFDVFRGQYYLHSFLKEQPNLNYYNPEVVDEMLRQCRFWLDLGIDGFRFDVINFCLYDKELRDNPPRTDGGLVSQLEFKDVYAMQHHVYDKSRSENMMLVKKLRALVDEYPDKMTLAEIADDDPLPTAAKYTSGSNAFHTAYSFALMTNKGKMPGAAVFRETLVEQLAQPGNGWPTWAFSNHDVVRAVSRWSGSDYGHDSRQAKMLIALLCSLRGTAFIYQGEELGLPEVDIPFEKISDPWGKYLYPKWKGRDGCRTPMPWDDSAQAGFTRAEEAWLPIPEAHKSISVARQQADDESVLSFSRRFLAWRKTQPVLRAGDIDILDAGTDRILAFTRRGDGEDLLCVFNLEARPAPYDGVLLQPYEARFVRQGRILFSSAPDD